MPTKVLETWAAKGLPTPDRNFVYGGVDAVGKTLKPIPYKDIHLNKSWNAFDLRHDLTKKDIEKFVADLEGTLRRPESVR